MLLAKPFSDLVFLVILCSKMSVRLFTVHHSYLFFTDDPSVPQISILLGFLPGKQGDFGLVYICNNFATEIYRRKFSSSKTFIVENSLRRKLFSSKDNKKLNWSKIYFVENFFRRKFTFADGFFLTERVFNEEKFLWHNFQQLLLLFCYSF